MAYEQQAALVFHEGAGRDAMVHVCGLT
jgi:hypothetical protein